MRPWPCLEASCRRDPSTRRPFVIDDGRERHRMGSVACKHLQALRDLARGEAWQFDADGAVGLRGDVVTCTKALGSVNASLREAGLISGWRDEIYGVQSRVGAPALALIERAAARFWGTLTFGAHANGYVTSAEGRPEKLWIARRALSKAVDPGQLDNLVGGGVPHGQTPFETLVREGWEEAGLDATHMQQARAAGVLRLCRDVSEGHQLEDLHVFDLELPPHAVPVNQDGEVAELLCLDVFEAIDRAAQGALTVDAALVTLSFAWRHKLLSADDVAGLVKCGAVQRLGWA